jgi:hypothetical protein
MKRLLILLPVALILAGCSSTNITKLVGALAKDPATSWVSVTTIYGTVKYVRIGVMTNESAQVSGDGTITIKTTGP